MTSKEAVNKLLYYATLDDSGFEPYMKEYANQIEEDLEILEFIKNHIQYTDNGLWYIDICEDDFDLKNEMTKEEWDNSIQKKIREWLNNGK